MSIPKSVFVEALRLSRDNAMKLARHLRAINSPVASNAVSRAREYNHRAIAEQLHGTGYFQPAPELLATLRELLESHQAQMPPYEDGKAAQDAWADRKVSARLRAMDVVAKAEGRS